MKYIKNFLIKILNLIKSIFSPITNIAKSNSIAFSFSILLHIIIVIGLFYTVNTVWKAPEKKANPQMNSKVIKTFAIDSEVIKSEEKRIKEHERKEQEELEQKEAKLAEIKKKENLAKKQVELAEKERIKNEQYAQKAQERKLQAEKEIKIIEKEFDEVYDKKIKAEEDVKRVQEITDIEIMKTKKEREKRQQLKADIAVKKEQFELDRELSAEELQDIELAVEDQKNILKQGYIASIAKKVKKNWRYNSSKDDWGCDVYIFQDQFGKVQSVNVQKCYTDDTSKAQSFKNSIERAAYKASPLPVAPDKSVFDAEILFYFRAN